MPSFDLNALRGLLFTLVMRYKLLQIILQLYYIIIRKIISMHFDEGK